MGEKQRGQQKGIYVDDFDPRRQLTCMKETEINEGNTLLRWEHTKTD